MRGAPFAAGCCLLLGLAWGGWTRAADEPPAPADSFHGGDAGSGDAAAAVGAAPARADVNAATVAAAIRAHDARVTSLELLYTVSATAGVAVGLGAGDAAARPPALSHYYVPAERRRPRCGFGTLGSVGVTGMDLGGVFAGRRAACFANASVT
jgi:hypothetical protein